MDDRTENDEDQGADDVAFARLQASDPAAGSRAEPARAVRGRDRAHGGAP